MLFFLFEVPEWVYALVVLVALALIVFYRFFMAYVITAR